MLAQIIFTADSVSRLVNTLFRRGAQYRASRGEGKGVTLWGFVKLCEERER
jgi:hypothetical protein